MLEPRFFPRATLTFAVVVRGGTSDGAGHLINLSEGGALVDFPSPLLPGELLTLEILVPGSATLAVAGRVVRSAPKGDRHAIALAFDELEETVAESIGDLIARSEAIAWSDEGARIPRDVAVRYVPMIRRIARSIAARLPAHVSQDDLVGSGFVAFVDLYAKHRDLPREELDRLARARIRGAMLDELRQLDPLSRRMRQEEKAIGAVRRDLEIELGRAPSHDEIAERAKLSPEDYGRIMQSANAANIASLDGEAHDIPADASEGPELALRDSMRRTRLQKALLALPPRLRQVLQLHVGEDFTLRAIGNVLGVSEARVSQLLSDAVKRLRDDCTSLPPDR